MLSPVAYVVALLQIPLKETGGPCGPVAPAAPGSPGAPIAPACPVAPGGPAGPVGPIGDGGVISIHAVVPVTNGRAAFFCLPCDEAMDELRSPPLDEGWMPTFPSCVLTQDAPLKLTTSPVR